MFLPDDLEKMKHALPEVTIEMRKALEQIMVEWLPGLKSPRAREYLTHGVGRRLRILQRCFENVFAICPVGHTEPLSDAERTDLEISLHAFVINVHGLLDNLAWVRVFEGTRSGGLPPRTQVGLFDKPIVGKYLSEEAREYLARPEIIRWYQTYANNYRDALAHRIPLYVPPSTMTKAEAKKAQELEDQIMEKMKSHDFAAMEALEEAQDKVGTFSPVFVHSYKDTDRSPPVAFHPQLIQDARTVVECIRVVSIDPKK